MTPRTLYLFSSQLELDAAFPTGAPDGVPIAVTGVGLIDAAIGTARAIATHRPEAIVFLGTCGAHRTSSIGIGDIVRATTLRLGSGDVARGQMRIPSLLPSEVVCDAGLGEVVAARIEGIVAGATVSCTLGVTENDELAALLAAHDASDVENLEVFAVARAADDLPVAALLGVTNIVGAGGGRDWLANHAMMMERLATCVEPMVSGNVSNRSTLR